MTLELVAGSNQYTEVPNSSGLPDYNGPYTVLFWYRQDTMGGLNNYPWSFAASSTSNGEEIRIDTSDRFRPYSRDQGSLTVTGPVMADITASGPGFWHLLGFRSDGTNIDTSINGSPFANAGTNSFIRNANGQEFLRFGRDRTTFYCTAALWNAIFFSSVLTDTDVDNFYNENYGAISTSGLYDYWNFSSDSLAGANGKHMTEYGSPTYTSDPVGRTAWPGAGGGPVDTPIALLISPLKLY